MTQAAGHKNTDPRMEAAVDWFYRRQSGSLSAADLEAFEGWLVESPANGKAYASVEAFWAGTAQAPDLPGFSAKREQILKEVKRARVTRRAGILSVAALAIALTGGTLYQIATPKPLVTQSFRTALGQRATVSLPDGSVMTLNTDTIVRTRADADRRLVYLDQGQAFFRVAKDKRHPFVVNAAGRTVTAVGTAFDVRVDGGALRVLLVEGRVRVESPPTPQLGVADPRRPVRAEAPSPLVARTTEMEPGSELVALGDGDWRMSRVNVERETSWLRGKIVVDNETLSDVVAELNRYSDRKMVIADKGLEQARLSGVFQPGDAKGFADSLRFTGLATMQEGPEGELRIVRLK